MSTLYGPFKQLVTFQDAPLKGPLQEQHLAVIENGGLLVANGMIEQVGSFNELKPQASEVVAIETEAVGMPGFVDSHTHICFGGSRARDYAARNAGKTYLEIAKEGGGIWDTVTKTREATQNELEDGIIRRAARHLNEGVTTIEVKSGYGLSIEEE